MSSSIGSSYFNSEANMNFTAKLGNVTSTPHRSDLETQIESNNNNELLFFNYHEYMVSEYTDLGTNISKVHTHPIVINHFPNNYLPLDSKLYKSTRIVRIPRIYSTGVEADCYPKFSPFLPGHEPAALIANEEDTTSFTPRGRYLGNIFGYTSLTPLSNYLSKEEYKEIIDEINGKLQRALDPFHYMNIMENIMDTLTLSVYSILKTSRSQSILIDLEKYVKNLNNTIFKEKGIEMISPKKSAYLSLDIQIPKPLEQQQGR